VCVSRRWAQQATSRLCVPPMSPQCGPVWPRGRAVALQPPCANRECFRRPAGPLALVSILLFALVCFITLSISPPIPFLRADTHTHRHTLTHTHTQTHTHSHIHPHT